MMKPMKEHRQHYKNGLTVGQMMDLVIVIVSHGGDFKFDISVIRSILSSQSRKLAAFVVFTLCGNINKRFNQNITKGVYKGENK